MGVLKITFIISVSTGLTDITGGFASLFVLCGGVGLKPRVSHSGQRLRLEFQFYPNAVPEYTTLLV